MAIKGWNKKFNFRISYWIHRDGKDVTFEDDNSGVYEEHVFFFSRYAAQAYAEKRLCMKKDEYLIRKFDEERWCIYFVQELTVDDLLIPDYNDAITEN